MRMFTCLALGSLLVAAVSAQHDAARALFAEKRYAEAQQKFTAAVAENPEDATAHYFLGRLARLRQELPVAIEHLEKALALRPEDAAIQFEYGAACSLHADTLGISFRAASMARRGRTALERAVELQPDSIPYRLALLEFYSTAPGIVGGSLAKAREQAEAIEQLDPVAGALALGGLARQQQRPLESMQHWQRVLALQPDHAFALFRLGEAAAMSGEQIEAGITALERSLAMNAAEQGVPVAQAHWRLGQLRARQEDPGGARAAFRAALEIDPMNREIAADLARLPAERAP